MDANKGVGLFSQHARWWKMTNADGVVGNSLVVQRETVTSWLLDLTRLLCPGLFRLDHLIVVVGDASRVFCACHISLLSLHLVDPTISSPVPRSY